MKRLLFAAVILFFAVANTATAQKQAQPDNGQFITVEQSTGANHQVHYKLTNKNSVAMDFTLYKQVSNNSWDITHHLNLQPGEVYDDVNSFTGLTGKYVVYSAPHSDWATFPSSFDIAKLQASGGAPPATPAPATTTPSTPASTPQATTPAPQNTPSQSASQAASQNKNSAPPPVPPM